VQASLTGLKLFESRIKLKSIYNEAYEQLVKLMTLTKTKLVNEAQEHKQESRMKLKSNKNQE
jgi:hypothetical protein